MLSFLSCCEDSVERTPTSVRSDVGVRPTRFLFVVCKLGAELALKHEIAAEWPDLHLAFSRPGFVTFKLPMGFDQPDNFDLRSVFARTYGFSLGRVSGSNTATMAARVWDLASQRPFQHLHVWQRDANLPGENGFEPSVTPRAQEIA